MKSSIFATTAPIGSGHGGGIGSYHECLALKDVTNLIQVLCPSCKADFGSSIVTELSLNGHYPDNPFMWDYITALEVNKAVDIAFLNGAPFTLTKKVLDRARIVIDMPAHNLELSIEEFERWQGSYPFKHMTDPYLWDLYTDFIRSADLIIAPSRMSAEYIKVNPGTGCPVEVVYKGTDIPEKVEKLPDRFTVGYLGATGPDKGVIYLLKAWAGLMYPDSELLIAGATTGQWVADITKQFTRARYNLLGYTENPSDFYNRCSVYIQPSVTEGFGLEVLEAMAHYRPVIVSKGAGVSELIEEGVDGFIVPIRDAESLADRIDYLKDNPDRMIEMGQKARVKAEQFTWDRVREGYKKLLEEI